MAENLQLYGRRPQGPQGLKRPIIIKGSLILGGVLLSYFIFKKIEKAIKLNREQKLIDTKADGLDLGGIAANIYDAFYNNDWFGATEDEIRAMQELAKLGVNKTLVPQLSDIYRKQYNHILKADFISYLTQDEYNAIKFYFE